MKKESLFVFILLFLFISVFVGLYINKITNTDFQGKATETQRPRTYDKYSIKNLADYDITAGVFKIGDQINESEKYSDYFFNFRFSPALDDEKKVTTGQINIPKGTASQTYPLVIMLRGYVDQELYTTGDGTRRAAEFFAENAYITLAPDFLGFAESDSEAGNIFESRFQTYVTVLSLLKSINQINSWDGENLFIWGHSNGGQIALTVLEITGAEIPTTLWAPVSKPFPYSILYYTDESDDGGKLIRRELGKFEDLYDTDLYSLSEYLNNIFAPLLIHQGSADDAVPVSWSNDLVESLENLEKEVEYFTYPGADHNLRPDWDSVVQRDLEFFNSYLK